MKVLGGLSTSVSVSVPVAVGVPGAACDAAASITEPVVVPEMTAASLVPVMVIVTTCAVPSMVVTVKRVGQRVADIERLHRAVGVVERVGPRPGRRDREGAVAARLAVGEVTAVKVLGALSTSVSVSVPVAVGVPGAAPPASITAPVVVPEMMAASLAAGDGDRHHLCGAVHGGHREGVGQRVADIERLHRAVGYCRARRSIRRPP